MAISKKKSNHKKRKSNRKSGYLMVDYNKVNVVFKRLN